MAIVIFTGKERGCTLTRTFYRSLLREASPARESEMEILWWPHEKSALARNLLACWTCFFLLLSIKKKSEYTMSEF